MKKSDAFERFFVEEIARRIEESKMTHSEFARQVYESESGPRIWRAVRESERKRSTSIGEAYMMAETLGKDFASLMWEITQEAKRKGILP